MSSTYNVPLIIVTEVTDETTPRPITNTFWSNFRQQVESGEPNSRAHALQCVLCLRLMLNPLGQVINDQHRPWILPCGHILGYTCLHRLAQGKSFSDYTLDVTCPKCHVHLPIHECGHKAVGMYAPLNKDSFSRVPPVLSEGGNAATNCGICEAKLALRELNAVAAADPPRLKLGKKMNLRILAEPFSGYIIYQDDRYHVVNRNLVWSEPMMKDEEVPEAVRDLWEDYVNGWSEQAQQVWFYPDPSVFSLQASVVDKTKAEMSLLERLLCE